MIQVIAAAMTPLNFFMVKPWALNLESGNRMFSRKETGVETSYFIFEETRPGEG